MATTEAKLTRTKMQRLLGKAREFEREADDMRTAGLDERAEKLEAEADQLRETVEASKKATLQEERERRRRNREARERHEAAQKEMEAERRRRQEAREWYRSWTAFSGGRPQPADVVLDAAERAGHDPADLEAGVVRLKRRSDGTICFGFRGEYLRGEFLPVEQRASSASR